MSTLPVTPDDRLIWDTWLAMYRLPVLTVADEVGTFAALSTQSLTTDELAARITVGARALAIHLGLLARWASSNGTMAAGARARRRGPGCIRTPPAMQDHCCIVCV